MKIKFCKCNCGEQITNIKNTFIFGHQRRNKKLLKKTKEKIRQSQLGRVPWNKGLKLEGRPHTEETKQKISNTKKGKYAGKDSYWYGKKHTPEAIQKMSESQKGEKNPNYGKRGKKHKPESLQKTSKAQTIRFQNNPGTFTGKKHTPESKEKLRIANVGKRHSLKTKRKIGKAHKGKVMSIEARQKIGAAFKGEKHPNWLGGKSFEPYGVEFNRELKERVRKRDNYICQLCQIKENSERHSIHHIDYDKKNNDPRNLITLCRLCHIKTNINRRQWELTFKQLKQKAI